MRSVALTAAICDSLLNFFDRGATRPQARCRRGTIIVDTHIDVPIRVEMSNGTEDVTQATA
jgi:hypothetical protein